MASRRSRGEGKAAAPVSVDAWRSELAEVGFVVAPGVLDRDEVERLCAAFGASTPGSTLHVEIDDDTPHVDVWRNLANVPPIAELISALLGPAVVRVHGRDPGQGAGAQGLHADRPAGRVHDVDSLTFLWMLDDFTKANGATRVVPCSHRGASPVPRSLAQPGERHGGEVVVSGNAGDVLIFDAHLWHSGRRNDTPDRRRIVQMAATRADLA